MIKICEICGATENIQEHHISYEPEIKQFLCVDCHKAVHNHGVGKAPGWTTKLFELLRSDAKMLFKEGATNKEVANACSVCPVTASHWRKKLGFGLPVWEPKIPKTEEEIARGIFNSMQRRNIKNTRTQLIYLHNQKEKKLNASLARMEKAEGEIQVIDKMLEGTI